jgi:outer membrane protein OmpA-like peptidoglycan-associated protein
MRGTSKWLAGLLIATAFVGHAQAEPEKMVVFFTEWSAALDNNANNVIDDAAKLAKSADGKQVTIRGYADTTGSEDANKLLSDLRAQVVADRLMEDGVSARAITKAGKGEIPADLFKQESRRVEISVE